MNRAIRATQDGAADSVMLRSPCAVITHAAGRTASPTKAIPARKIRVFHGALEYADLLSGSLTLPTPSSQDVCGERSSFPTGLDSVKRLNPCLPTDGGVFRAGKRRLTWTGRFAGTRARSGRAQLGIPCTGGAEGLAWQLGQ